MFEQTLAERSASEIVAAVRAKEFVFVRRGYDQDQVRQFLVEAAGAIERLEETRLEAQREQKELRAEVELLRSELERLGSGGSVDGDPFEQTGIRVAEILRSVNAEAAAIRRQAEAIKDQATREVEEVKLRANSEAEEVKLQATREAEEVREQAKSEARGQAQALLHEALEELASSGDVLLQEMEDARRRVSGVLDGLRSSIREQEISVEPAAEGGAPSGSTEPEVDDEDPAAAVEPTQTGVEAEPVEEPRVETAPVATAHDDVDPVLSEVVGDDPVTESAPAPVEAEPVNAHAEAIEPEHVEPELEQAGSRYETWMYAAPAEPVNGDPESGEPSNDQSDHAEPAGDETEQGDPDQNGNGKEPILSFVFGSGPEAAPIAPPAEPAQTDGEPGA